MKLGRCPVCHSNLHLDAMVQDEAGRELLGMLAKMDTALASASISYLALFRPAKRELSNAKALTLLSDTLNLTPDKLQLIQAMDATVQNIQQRRQEQQNVKPLANHNYLKQVLANTPAGANHEIRQSAQLTVPSPTHSELTDLSWAKQS